MSWKDDIRPLEELREKLSELAHRLQFDVFNGKTTTEVAEIIDISIELKHAIQGVKDESTDTLQERLRTEKDLDPDLVEKFKGVVERGKVAQAKFLKRALRLAKEAQVIYDKYKNLKKGDVKKEEEEKEEPKKEPEKKPEPKKEKKEPKKQPEKKPVQLPPEITKPHEKYVNSLDELKARAERAIIDKVPDLEKDALDFLRDFLDENLDTKDGNFVANERAQKALNKFPDVMAEAIAELKDYKGSVSKYLKNFKDIATLMEEHQTNNGVNVKQARLGAVQELVTAEILDRYSENGLNKGFVQPLREILFNNITGGLNKKQAMTQLKEYIAGGKDETGKLGRYLEQTAQQGVDSYTGAINVKIMQTFKIDTYVVSGSLIETSSPQCRLVINKMDGLLDRKDWPKVESLAEDNGLIEGTDFDNLPINKLHWGCRHEFTPLVLTEKQKEKLLANPVNN